jgi:hypothetical protein
MEEINNQNYPEGMVSYWKFDEGSGTAAGDSAGESDGEINGATWVEEGMVGSALSFDGEDDYVITGAKIGGLDEYSISAWVKTSFVTLKQQQSIYTEDHSHNPGTNALQILTRGRIWMRGGSGTQSAMWDLEMEIRDGNWHHLVVTYSNNRAELYVDGVSRGVKNGMFKWADIDNGWIGRRGGDGSPYPSVFKGELDEVAICNRPLTPEEIKQHYENGLKGLGYGPGAVEAAVNIDPDTLNIKSRGVFTAYITLPEWCNVEDVDAGTIECSGASASKTSIEDGRLVAKFNRGDLDIQAGDAVELAVTGELNDGMRFEGSDTIQVMDKGR